MPKPKIAYVTLLDQYHPGIFDSQVIDVCNYLTKNFDADVQLIAFLSIKELHDTNAKKIIKSKCKNAIVLPAFPKLRWFFATRFLLFLVLLIKPKKALICRNVFAMQIGLAAKKIGLVKRVAFDGRSAIAAEVSEYDVFPTTYFRKNAARLEKKAVIGADFCLAVSNQLIQYWINQYQYSSKKNVVIPCTLQSNIVWKPCSSENDVVKIVYAGSNAPWQGFDQITTFLHSHPHLHCTLLTKKSAQTDAMQAIFKERLTIKWLASSQVSETMATCDYGLLLRPQSVTNKVASPGKFAEYLACGLSVIITPNLGDYSEFVINQNCGYVWKNNEKLTLEKLATAQKEKNNQLSKAYFFKESPTNFQNYGLLINNLIK